MVCGKHSWSPWSRRRMASSRMRGFSPFAMLPTINRLYSNTMQQLAGGALQSRHGPQHGHVPCQQAHDVVWVLRRVVEQATEWQIPVFVMDCDVAAAFDQVSHHGITEATLAMEVPPVLIAAWIREYRNSETIVKLDDIGTSGIRHTRSVPQGDPCAEDLFGEVVCKMCQQKQRDCPWEADIWVFCSSRTIAGSSRCRLESSVVLDGARQFGSKHHRVGQIDHSAQWLPPGSTSMTWPSAVSGRERSRDGALLGPETGPGSEKPVIVLAACVNAGSMF